MNPRSAVLLACLSLAGCAADASPSSEPDGAVVAPAPTEHSTELAGPAFSLPLEEKQSAKEAAPPGWKVMNAAWCTELDEVRCSCGVCAVESACVSLCEGPEK